MSKQTAVEWFFNELQRMQYFIGNDMLQAYEQSKAMEREQSMELIELTSQLTGVATVDEEIAKMEYIDVYNQYYKGG